MLHRKGFPSQDGIVHPSYCFSCNAPSGAAPKCSFASCLNGFLAQVLKVSCPVLHKLHDTLIKRQLARCRVRHLWRWELHPICGPSSGPTT